MKTDRRKRGRERRNLKGGTGWKEGRGWGGKGLKGYGSRRLVLKPRISPHVSSVASRANIKRSCERKFRKKNTKENGISLSSL